MRSYISSDITTEQYNGIIQAIDALDALLVFTVNLKPNERKENFTLTDSRQAFTQKSLRYGEEYSTSLPPSISINELRMDLNVRMLCQRMLERIRPLVEKLEDTFIAAGIDSLKIALDIYNQLKASKRSGTEGLACVLDDLGQLFTKKSSKPTDEPEVPPVDNVDSGDNAANGAGR